MLIESNNKRINLRFCKGYDWLWNNGNFTKWIETTILRYNDWDEVIRKRKSNNKLYIYLFKKYITKKANKKNSYRTYTLIDKLIYEFENEEEKKLKNYIITNR